MDVLSDRAVHRLAEKVMPTFVLLTHRFCVEVTRDVADTDCGWWTSCPDGKQDEILHGA